MRQEEYNNKRALLSTTQLAKSSLEKDPKKHLKKREKKDLDMLFSKQQSKISQFMVKERIGDETTMFKVLNDVKQELMAEVSSGKKAGADYSRMTLPLHRMACYPSSHPLAHRCSSALSTQCSRPTATPVAALSLR